MPNRHTSYLITHIKKKHKCHAYHFYGQFPWTMTHRSHSNMTPKIWTITVNRLIYENPFVLSFFAHNMYTYMHFHSKGIFNEYRTKIENMNHSLTLSLSCEYMTSSDNSNGKSLKWFILKFRNDAKSSQMNASIAQKFSFSPISLLFLEQK